jgi:hypothetical protein
VVLSFYLNFELNCDVYVPDDGIGVESSIVTCPLSKLIVSIQETLDYPHLVGINHPQRLVMME